MDLKNLEFRKLTIKDKDLYNSFYLKNKLPNSDYCFSVIFSWLDMDEAVNYALLTNDLILLKYNDILDTGKSITNIVTIGNPNSINKDLVNYLINFSSVEENKTIILESQKHIVEELLPENLGLIYEQGLSDYVFSVEGYSNLNSPVYKRIRRSINIFNRDYKTPKIETKLISKLSKDNKKYLLNLHHSWDNTFKFENDPERLEGIALSKSIMFSDDLGIKLSLIRINDIVEGFFLFTEVIIDGNKYADVHHARSSNKYKHFNDYAFHLLGEQLHSLRYKYINFERDADVEGLRQHKELLKPVKMLKAYSLSKN